MDDKIIAALWPSSTIDTGKTKTEPSKPVEGGDSLFAAMVKNQQESSPATTVKADNMVSALRQIEEIARTQGTDALVNIQLANSEQAGGNETITVKANAHETAAALYGKWQDK